MKQHETELKLQVQNTAAERQMRMDAPDIASACHCLCDVASDGMFAGCAGKLGEDQPPG